MSTTRICVATFWAALIVGPISQFAWGQARPTGDEFSLFGRVAAVAADGKGITIEAPPQNRGEQPRMVEIKFDAATQIVYQAVGPNGAKPTEGYNVRIALAAGSKDQAASVVFSSPTVTQADVVGRIASVSGDGLRIVVEGRPQARGEGGNKSEVKLTESTTVLFQGVGPDGAKLAEGQFVQVWLKPDSKDTALRVVAVSPPTEGRSERRELRGPDAQGQVSAVSSDGKTITLLSPPANRGDEPKKTEIKLVEATDVTYSNVGRGGALAKEGYFAAVYLQPGSTDVAASVRFGGSERDPIDVAGRVTSVASDGRSFLIEKPPMARGEEPKRREVKLGEKTRVVYSNVGPDGAKPTEGYFAQVVLESSTSDTAATVNFIKPFERR